MSTIQGQTYIARDSPEIDQKAEKEPAPWSPVPLSPRFGGSDAEGDLHRMAISMNLHFAEKNLSQAPAYRDQQLRYVKEIKPENYFLSMKDKQYIRALVVMGYREDASRLVQQAYEKRKREIGSAMGYRGGHGLNWTLFTLFDIEYLEMLLLVGDRRRAIMLVLRVMDDYELKNLGQIVRTTEAQAKIDREYFETMRAIETTGSLPPEIDTARSRTSLHRLLRRLCGAISRN